MIYYQTVTDPKGNIIWKDSDCTIPKIKVVFETIDFEEINGNETQHTSIRGSRHDK